MRCDAPWLNNIMGFVLGATVVCVEKRKEKELCGKGALQISIPTSGTHTNFTPMNKNLCRHRATRNHMYNSQSNRELQLNPLK